MLPQAIASGIDASRMQNQLLHAPVKELAHVEHVLVRADKASDPMSVAMRTVISVTNDGRVAAVAASCGTMRGRRDGVDVGRRARSDAIMRA